MVATSVGSHANSSALYSRNIITTLQLGCPPNKQCQNTEDNSISTRNSNTHVIMLMPRTQPISYTAILASHFIKLLYKTPLLFGPNHVKPSIFYCMKCY